MNLIERSLEDGPLSGEEIYQNAMKLGWTSNSANPKAVFKQSLIYYTQNGKIRKVGTDYELPSGAGAGLDATS